MTDEERTTEQEQLKSKVEAMRQMIAGLDNVETRRKQLQEMLEHVPIAFSIIYKQPSS